MFNELLGNVSLSKFNNKDELFSYIKKQHKNVVEKDIEIQRMMDRDLDFEPCHEYLYHYFVFLFDENNFTQLINEFLQDEDKNIVNEIKTYLKSSSELDEQNQLLKLNPCIISLHFGWGNTRDYHFSFQFFDLNVNDKNNVKDCKLKNNIKDYKLKDNVDLYDFLDFIPYPCLMVKETEFSHDFDIYQGETHYHQIVSMKNMELNKSIPNGQYV